MGNKIDLLEDVRNRLQTAITSGDLTEIKQLRIGFKAEARTLTNYPILNLSLESGGEEFVSMPFTKVDRMTITITLIDNKLEGLNAFYDTATQTGSLYLFEKLLNVLDKTVGGQVDLSMGQKANDRANYPYTVNQLNKLIEYELNYEIPTRQFLAGAR